MRSLLIALAVILSAGSTFTTAQGVFNEARAYLEDERNTIDIIKEYGDSVVSVNVVAAGRVITREQMQDPFEQFGDMLPPQFRDFFRFELPEGEQRTPERQGSGSGFLIDDEGSIITNYHVIAQALDDESTELREGSSVSVLFPSYDDEIAMRVVGVNVSYDLALLEPLEPLPRALGEVRPISIADSDAVEVGQKTIAIGNPFGLSSTVTTGIVSAVSRDFPGIGMLPIPMIQTDAAINPGNSGGPLLNSRGEVIGINTAIIPSVGIGGSRGNVGIGFAVPANFLSENLEAMREGGFYDLYGNGPRIGIGIRSMEDYPRDFLQDMNLPERGVAVTAVQPDGAGDKAGLRGSRFELNIGGQAIAAPGDIILAVDGVEVETATDLQRQVFSRQAGDMVTLTILRNGEEQSLEVTLQAASDE